MDERQVRGLVVAASVGVSALSAACLHNFDAFDPVAGEDSGPGVAMDLDAGGKPDVGGGVDAGFDAGTGGEVDAAKTHDAGGSGMPEASAADTGPSCGSDCKIEATSCAGTCAYDEQSCAAACTGADAGGCTTACMATQGTCTEDCVSTCETCTSGAGCIDVAGCMAAAP